MRTPLPLLLLFPLISGCSSQQSVLATQGAAADALNDLILTIVLICTVIWLMVALFMLGALVRRRTPLAGEAVERVLAKYVWWAGAATVVTVVGLTIGSYYTTRRLNSSDDAALVVRVKAQQWWWQFLYVNEGRQPAFKTANELHIPVGRDVRLELESLDVIHSLWIPSLAGKLDMIPGRKNIITLRAQKAGIYRGQCAEFCGLQHSHMAFLVIAEEDADFNRWRVQQAAPSYLPSDGEAAGGRTVFMTKPCAACHTIRGTPAVGTSGPDLTHVASRRTIGAGLLETTRGSLAAWIADPQTLKPGNNMPLVPLTGDELRQVSAYMESLK